MDIEDLLDELKPLFVKLPWNGERLARLLNAILSDIGSPQVVRYDGERCFSLHARKS